MRDTMACQATLLARDGTEIRVMGERAEEVLMVGRELATTLQKPGETAPPVVAHVRDKIFVVHGHDEGARESVARFVEKIGLTAIILQEQPNQGRTIIEKFVDYAREVGFAVVLLTPDDLGGAAATEMRTRARQNVIFELGYFVGSLGRGRACLLRKGEVEIPSDLYGVVYTDMDGADGWKWQLARELRAAGFEFDANKVLA
jgi:predicted nucleotide-binding protein